MVILPAIDLHSGVCVRLYKGDFNTAGKVAESATDTAEQFKAAGAQWIHMVDLDGAKTGERKNRNMIISVSKKTSAKIEVGGGIRDMATIEDYLENGISRVIIGSAALKNPEFVKQAVGLYSDKIAVGIDAENGFVSTEGWIKKSDVTFINFARQIEQTGVKYIIFTDISCDGTLQGPNFEQLAALQNAVSCNIIASGGIRDLEHIKQLASMNLYGAICGKSIYSGTLNLQDAIKEGGNRDAC